MQHYILRLLKINVDRRISSQPFVTLQIYDGSFSQYLVDGMGVTAALLSQHGICVFNETQIDEALDAAEPN